MHLPVLYPYSSCLKGSPSLRPFNQCSYIERPVLLLSGWYIILYISPFLPVVLVVLVVLVQQHQDTRSANNLLPFFIFDRGIPIHSFLFFCKFYVFRFISLFKLTCPICFDTFNAYIFNRISPLRPRRARVYCPYVVYVRHVSIVAKSSSVHFRFEKEM